ncbi:MAG: 50S ribosomal protein L6 [Anaerolineae bacterium]
MSRIGQMPIPLPEEVSATVKGNTVRVQGPRGEMSRSFDPAMRIELEDNLLRVYRPTDARHHRALHGLTRALLANMVKGVKDGFERELEIQGVGYRAELKPDGSLEMSLGYSHPVVIEPPEGIEFEVSDRSQKITVSGVDKEKVGQVAAEIRAKRPVEPYKGKGIRYVGEHVRRKSGKAGKTI